MTIKSVCFDLGGVAAVRDIEAALACGREKWGNSFTEETLHALTKAQTPDHDYWREWQNGQISSDDYLRAAFSSIGFPSASEDLLHAKLCLAEWCGQPYQPIINLALDLQEQGYQTSVLSNNNEIMYFTEAALLRRLVDVSLSSHQIGVSKPEEQAYRILLERLGHPDPATVLFIDDKLRNIHGAENVGLQGFHFRSKEISMDEAFEELVQYLKGKFEEE